MDDNKRLLIVLNFVGIMVVIGSYVGLVAFTNLEPTVFGLVTNFLSLVAGILLANSKDATGFEFGSSQSSKAKDDAVMQAVATAAVVADTAARNGGPNPVPQMPEIERNKPTDGSAQ